MNRRLPWTAAGGALLVVTLAASCGRLHWLLDLAANFRWHLFLAAALGLALTIRHRRIAPACAALALVANGWPLLPYWLPPGAADRLQPRPVGRPASVASVPPEAAGRPATLSVVSLNVHGRNRQRERVVAYLRDRSADVVALLEVDRFWEGVITELADLYPHRHVHARDDFYGLALISRLPMTDVRVVELAGTGLPNIIGHLRPAGTELVVIATHPRAPTRPSYAHARDRQLRAIAELVAATPRPCLVLGDLNATPFSAGFRDLISASGLKDTALGRGLPSTWHAALPVPGVPIDHILVPAATRVTHRAVGPWVGSDHLPVEASLVLP